MPTDAATAIAYVGAFVGFVGGGVALFNSWKAVCWKRAELANGYMKEFTSNPELVFAGRCLDWRGGRIVLPEGLRPYMPDNSALIEHDQKIFAHALRADLRVEDLTEDPRIHIYRTSMDSFLSWLSLVASALERRLFLVDDVRDIEYWVDKIESEAVLHPFIAAYGYQASIEKLTHFYRRSKWPYQKWRSRLKGFSERLFRRSAPSAPRSHLQ
jgi:hypothetical protein